MGPGDFGEGGMGGGGMGPGDFGEGGMGGGESTSEKAGTGTNPGATIFLSCDPGLTFVIANSKPFPAPLLEGEAKLLKGGDQGVQALWAP